MRYFSELIDIQNDLKEINEKHKRVRYLEKELERVVYPRDEDGELLKINEYKSDYKFFTEKIIEILKNEIESDPNNGNCEKLQWLGKSIEFVVLINFLINNKFINPIKYWKILKHHFKNKNHEDINIDSLKVTLSSQIKTDDEKHIKILNDFKKLIESQITNIESRIKR